MIVKSNIVVEVSKPYGDKGESRTYSFIIPIGAPFGEAFDAAFETLSAVLDLSKKAIEDAKKNAPESAPSENVVAEVVQ